MRPRIWAALLWPVWYLVAFIGGSIAIGPTAVIVYETVRVVLPWADSAAEVWRRAGVI
jgi:hypothetical protein